MTNGKAIELIGEHQVRRLLALTGDEHHNFVIGYMVAVADEATLDGLCVTDKIRAQLDAHTYLWQFRREISAMLDREGRRILMGPSAKEVR